MFGRRFIAFVVCMVAVAGRGAAQTNADFFSDTGLAELRLFVNPADWQLLRERYFDNTYYPAELQWQGVVVRNVGIRSRGSASRSAVKPGLRVDIDYYLPSQEFLGVKSFILDNHNTDESTLREVLTMRLFERLGLPAPRERHVNLYVNDQLAGVYSVVESVDKRFLARVIEGPDEKIANAGYLYEFRHRREYDFSYLGGDLTQYALLFEPRTHESDAPATLWGPIEQWIKTINEDGPIGIERALSPYLDLRQFLRYVAVETFVAQYDGVGGFWGANNFYVYRFPKISRFQFLPWDQDQAFRAANQSIWFGTDRSVLLGRLLGVPALRTAYLDALVEVARSATEPVFEGGPGWLQAQIESEYFQLDGAIRSDPFRWQATWSFGNEVDRLLEFAATRGQFVLCEVDSARDPRFATPCTAPDRTSEYAPGPEQVDPPESVAAW